MWYFLFSGVLGQDEYDIISCIHLKTTLKCYHNQTDPYYVEWSFLDENGDPEQIFIYEDDDISDIHPDYEGKVEFIKESGKLDIILDEQRNLTYVCKVQTNPGPPIRPTIATDNHFFICGKLTH